MRCLLVPDERISDTSDRCLLASPNASHITRGPHQHIDASPPPRSCPRFWLTRCPPALPMRCPHHLPGGPAATHNFRLVLQGAGAAPLASSSRRFRRRTCSCRTWSRASRTSANSRARTPCCAPRSTSESRDARVGIQVSHVGVRRNTSEFGSRVPRCACRNRSESRAANVRPSVH